MNKSHSTVNLILALAFFVALAMIATLGVPFLKIPALIQSEELNLSSDFVDGYEIVATVLDPEATDADDAQSAGSASLASEILPVLQRRAAALQYDVKVVDLKDGTVSFRFPAEAKADDPAALTKQICAPCVLSFVDSNGDTVIPAEALAEATPGYGNLSSTGTDMSYYISFRVKDEYVTMLADATAKLAEQSDGTSSINAANVMHIRLDGQDILAATVGESMSNGSFTISGSFDDESEPVLYAALINNGAINATIATGEMTDCAAPLSENAFAYFWIGFAALIVLCTLIVCICYRTSALSYLATNAFYCFFTGFCFQAFGMRFSINSLIGFLIGFIVLSLILMRFYSKVKQEFAGGKTARAAIERGMKKALPFYLVFGLIVLVLSTALWVVSTVFGWSATGLSLIYEASASLFAASLFTLTFAYWSVNFWYKVLLGFGANAPKSYGARLKAETNE